MSVRPEDLAKTLLARAAIQRQASEEDAVRIRNVLLSEIRKEIAEGTFKKAWIIGSLAWGSFGESSDVDVVVEGLASDHLPQLMRQFELLTGRAVDLLRIEELPIDFANRACSEGLYAS